MVQVTDFAGHAVLFISQWLYAAYAVLGRETFKFVAVEIVLCLRFWCGFLQVVVMTRLHPGCKEVRQRGLLENWGSWWKVLQVLLLGVISMVINTYLYLLGIKWTDAVTAASFQCTCAACTIIIGALVGLERFTLLKAGAIALAIGGDVLVLKLWTVSASNTTFIYGVLCLIGNVFSFAVFVVFVKPIFRVMPTFYVLQFLFGVGVLGNSILAVTASPPDNWKALGRDMTNTAVAGIVFAMLAMGALPYILNGVAFHFKMTSAMTTLYSAWQPLLATFLSYFISGTVIDWIQGVGIGVVILALALGSYAQHLDLVAAAEAEAAAAAAAATANDDTTREPFSDGANAKDGEAVDMTPAVVVGAAPLIAADAGETAPPR